MRRREKAGEGVGRREKAGEDGRRREKAWEGVGRCEMAGDGGTPPVLPRAKVGEQILAVLVGAVSGAKLERVAGGDLDGRLDDLQ